MAKLISKTYGEALFELAVEEGKVDTFLEEITAVQKILDENEDFTKLLNHPKILKEEKTGMITNVFKGRICDELVGFINLVIVKDRYREIDSILDFFLMEVKKLKGIGVAFVTTAEQLTQTKQNEVKEKLLATNDFRDMEIHYEVDAALIGGMVIRIGDRVVDSSVSTKLSDMKNELLQIQL